MAKRKTKTSLAVKACKLIQKFVRLDETDDNGYGECCSCGRIVHCTEADGGHFQPKGRNYNAACINRENIHLQCRFCNGFMGGNPAGYSKYMVNKYGEGILEELFLLSKQLSTREMMEDVIEEYTPLVKELEKQKVF